MGMGSSRRRSDPPSFNTYDLNLCSYLLCRGFEIGDIRQSESRTCFAFADSAALRRAVLDYANDGPVGGRSFSNTVRDLKALTRDVGGAEWKSLGQEQPE